jgi:hypothetical protein
MNGYQDGVPDRPKRTRTQFSSQMIHIKISAQQHACGRIVAQSSNFARAPRWDFCLAKPAETNAPPKCQLYFIGGIPVKQGSA